MALRSLKSFFPTADELLAADLPRLGEVLLVHVDSYTDRVKQQGKINPEYLRAMLENRNVGLGPLPPEPEYGAQQPAVTQAVMEAWNWLEREGMVIRTQIAGLFTISRQGEEKLAHFRLVERWELFGVERVKDDLMNGGKRVLDVGRPAPQRNWLEEWIRTKEGQAMLPVRKAASSQAGSSFIASSRIEELRKSPSADFDFQKLIRLCEELNSSYDNGNYYATAMLTRGVLDHVPPLFGHSTFAQVANNYSGGGRSFKEAMQHLDGAARKVGDAHLHMPIRNSETLPTPHQVYCGSQLDFLLSEIVRITK